MLGTRISDKEREGKYGFVSDEKNEGKDEQNEKDKADEDEFLDFFQKESVSSPGSSAGAESTEDKIEKKKKNILKNDQFFFCRGIELSANRLLPSRLLLFDLLPGSPLSSPSQVPQPLSSLFISPALSTLSFLYN